MVSIYPGEQMGIIFKFKLLEEVKKVRTNHIRGSLSISAGWACIELGPQVAPWASLPVLSVLNFVLPYEREATDIRN